MLQFPHQILVLMLTLSQINVDVSNVVKLVALPSILIFHSLHFVAQIFVLANQLLLLFFGFVVIPRKLLQIFHKVHLFDVLLVDYLYKMGKYLLELTNFSLKFGAVVIGLFRSLCSFEDLKLLFETL
jgi:hypothetical protein